VLCRGCGLNQLDYVVPPELLYRNEYPYEASTTRTGREHFHSFAEEAVERFGLGKRDLVLDVGSNVGVLLAGFQRCGTRILGVDPASNIVLKARENGIPTLDAFFDSDTARRIRDNYGTAAVLTATNCFAHIHDVDDFVRSAKRLLKPRGVLIIEAPHLLDLVRGLEYDTIYHEHLSYLSVKPLISFFKKRGLEVFDVQKRSIHGGSLRVFAGREARHPVLASVGKVLREERRAGIHDPKRLERFARDVAKNRDALQDLLFGLRRKGARLAGVSAPAKGMTLLNYCSIGTGLLEFVTEKSPLKIGRFTPGGHIPVLPDSALKSRRPDYALLLAWNFSKEIMANLKDFRKRGGKFIIPIPKPRIAR